MGDSEEDRALYLDEARQLPAAAVEAGRQGVLKKKASVVVVMAAMSMVRKRARMIDVSDM